MLTVEVATGVEKRIGEKTRLSGGSKKALDQDTGEIGYDELGMMLRRTL